MNFLTENPYESRRWDFGRPPRACGFCVIKGKAAPGSLRTHNRT
jgi:hypothetical protein